MTRVLGDVVSETFSTGIAGETFTRTASYIDGIATVWNPSFTDLGGGFYRYTYAPVVAGIFEWGGTSSGGTAVEINFDIATVAQSDPFAAAADNYSDVDSLGYKVRAIFARGVRLGNG